MAVESFLRIQKPDGTQGKLRVVTEQPLTMGAAQELVKAQGATVLGGLAPEEMPEPTALPPNVGRPQGPQTVANTEQTTSTTTTPHPWAEGAGAAIGSALPPALGALLGGGPPGGAAGLGLRTAGGGAGAVAGRALAEGRLPTPVEAQKAFTSGAASSVGGEALTKAGGTALKFAAGPIKEGVAALRRLGPVLSGQAAKGAQTPQAVQARAWWQHYAGQGKEALVQAWDDLAKKGGGVASEVAEAPTVTNVGTALRPKWDLASKQTPTKLGPKELFGPEIAGDMETVVSTMRKSMTPVLTEPEVIRQGTSGYLGQRILGLPAAIVAGTADLARRRGLPALFSKMATREGGADLVTNLASVIEGTAPVVGQASRAAGTVGPRGVFDTILPPLKPSSRTRARGRTQR